MPRAFESCWNGNSMKNKKKKTVFVHGFMYWMTKQQREKEKKNATQLWIHFVNIPFTSMLHVQCSKEWAKKKTSMTIGSDIVQTLSNFLKPIYCLITSSPFVIIKIWIFSRKFSYFFTVFFRMCAPNKKKMHVNVLNWKYAEELKFI